MSGVELAGLVLGALPVAVAALELYKTKIGPLFFTIRRDYLKDLRALEFHQLEITHCLGKLLLPMLRDKTELEQLIASPSDEQWNEKIHPALEARLGQNYYPTFVKVVSDINQVLEELKSKLVVGDDDIQAQLKREVPPIPTKQDTKSSGHHLQRVTRKYLTYQVYRAKFYKETESRTQLLEDLREYRRRLEALENMSAPVAGRLVQTQEPDIDYSVCGFWHNGERLFEMLLGAWNCTCYEQHCAHLMLQHPRSEEEFHLKLSADDVPHDLSTPLMNCSFRVREQNEVSGPKINTLCALFGQSAYGSGHIEYLNKTYHISFESAKQYKCTSLSQALLTQHELKLTLQKLYRLALTLASSFVQLKDSPWLFTSWDKRSVLFLDPQNNGKLVLDVPFVSRTFDPPYATQSLGHDVDSIVSLGIVLVELCLGQAIERHPKRLQSPEASDRMKFGLDLLAALQLLDDVNGKAGPDYAAAIGWCLTGCRMVPDDGTWRKEMVRKVVAPLERGYNYISRTP